MHRAYLASQALSNRAFCSSLGPWVAWIKASGTAAGWEVWWGWKLPVRIHRPAHCSTELHRTALADLRWTGRQTDRQTRATGAEWSIHQTPDPHRCFSDLPTAPQGLFKGPKPRGLTHRDFIEPWTGARDWPASSSGHQWLPPSVDLHLPNCPEKEVRALSLLAWLYQQV